MNDLYSIKLSFEKKHREGLMTSLATVQGGKHYVFASLWECFAWAAIIGFLHNKRKKIETPIADRPFSLQTMKSNEGEKIADSLVCLCISKHGSLDILKEPDNLIQMINEYANGGFYHIQQLIDNGQHPFNTMESVKQEIFQRNTSDM